MFDRPERIKAEFVGEARQPDLLVPRLIVAHALPAISGEHHLDADVHHSPPARATYREPITIELWPFPSFPQQTF